MTRNRWAAYACMSALVGGALGVLSPPASAAVVSPTDAATALDLPAGVTASVSGSSIVATQAFDDFPATGSSYLALSTGDADQIFTQPHDAQLSTDRGSVGPGDDASTLTLTVQPDAAVGCVYVDFAMATEEPVHTAVPDTAGDTLSVTTAGDTTEYAQNTGDAYFAQDGWNRVGPVPYTVNAVQYWHQPGDESDPVPGQYGPGEPSRLPLVTGLNNVTTRDTARVPVSFGAGGDQPATVTVSVSDVGNADLDSVAFVDHVHTGAACYGGTGVEPNPSNGGGLIRGTKAVGQELTYDPVPDTPAIETDPAATGWRSPSGVPVELRYRWYRTISTYALNGDMSHWTPIPDADRQSYVPRAADYGKVLIVLVTGMVDGRNPATFPSTGVAGSSPSWYVTTNIGTGTFIGGSQPTIIGPDQPNVGDTLTATAGDAFPRQDSWTWQWYANNASISGANSSTLILSDSEAGKTITVRATAKRLDFTDRSWTSAAYGPVAYKGWTSTATPTIVTDGTPAVGETVSVDEGTGWEPAPDHFTYQWKRNGTALSVTASTYKLLSSDAGKTLTVVVTPVKPGFAPASVESAGVPVAGATMTTAIPTVTGTPQVGQTLTGAVSGWEANASLTFAWYAGTTQLQSGLSHLFKVPAAAVGKPITLRVIGTKSGFETGSADSLATAAVLKGVLSGSQPTIVGTPRVGQTLYASKGSWGPYGVKISFRWRVNGVAVTGAAGRASSYRIPRSARGKRITVVATGTLAGYTTLHRTSTATKRVGA